MIKKRFFWPDCHAPFHDIKAVKLALEVLRDFGPDEVVILGDFFDCYTVSQYSKDPKNQYKLLEEELEPGRALLNKIFLACPNVVFLSGNHENRIDRYVAHNAGALGGSINTRDVLKLPRQVKYIPYGSKNRHQCGKLIATHGTIFNRHVCASMVQKYGCSIVFGHVHRIQEFHVRNAHGEDFTAFSPGWLGDPEHADYIQDLTDWSQGFALAWFKSNGDFFHQIIHIKKHELIFNGKLYG